MVDWAEMRGAMERAGGMPKRDIIDFLHTEKNISRSDGDEFLTNLYGQAIIEIEHLRRLVEELKADILYYQQLTRE